MQLYSETSLSQLMTLDIGGESFFPEIFLDFCG